MPGKRKKDRPSPRGVKRSAGGEGRSDIRQRGGCVGAERQAAPGVSASALRFAASPRAGRAQPSRLPAQRERAVGPMSGIPFVRLLPGAAPNARVRGGDPSGAAPGAPRSRTRRFVPRHPERPGFPAGLRREEAPFSFARRAYPRSARRKRMGPLRSYFFSGIVKRNRVEAASLSARRVARCSDAMVEAMGSPRPKPDFSPREASAR